MKYLHPIRATLSMVRAFRRVEVVYKPQQDISQINHAKPVLSNLLSLLHFLQNFLC